MSQPRYHLDSLLTIEELAAKLKVSVSTVRDWRRRKKIPFTRLERRLYVHAGIVEGILRRNSVAALPGPPKPTLAEQGGAQTREDET